MCNCKQSSLFFYNRVEKTPVQKESGKMEIEVKVFRDSFNLNHVLRTMSVEQGDNKALVVVMNDVHEEYMPIPVKKDKSGKDVVEQRKVPYNTQIAIEDENDIKRFFELFDK